MRVKTAIRSEENRCRMHTPYAEETPQLCLNGEWKVRVYDRAEDVPGDWASYEPSEDDRTLKVPGCFETQGIGKPIYTNIVYPFIRGEDHSFEKEVTAGRYELNAPAVPKENLTFCY